MSPVWNRSDGPPGRSVQFPLYSLTFKPEQSLYQAFVKEPHCAVFWTSLSIMTRIGACRGGTIKHTAGKEMPKILVIDDESVIVDLVSAYLRNEGYKVLTESDGVAGLAAARRTKPDIIVLDVMLPGLDGIELLRRLRQESDAYVIMLTARADEVDKIIGLSVGADDYLTKPFSPRELVARVKAAFRRLQTAALGADRATLAFRHVRIDLGGRKVWVDDAPIDLTSTEFELLRVLAQHRGIVLSREQLLELVWGHDFFGEERVVDVHLGHVRHKLGMPDLIQTVRGVGFRFEDEPA